MSKSLGEQAREIFSKEDLLKLSIRKPLLAQLELTRNCNQRCVFCFRSCDRKKVFEDLSLVEWFKILEELWGIGVDTLNLSGGEILLFRELESFLKEAKRRNFDIILNTNGTLPLLGYTRYLNEVVFSIHGIGEKHDRVTGTRGSFNLAEKHLSEVAAAVPRVGINTVLVEENFHDIAKIYGYFNKKHKNLSYHSFTLPITALFGNNLGRPALILNKERLAYYLDAIDRIPPHKRKYKHGMRALVEKDRSYYTSDDIVFPDCAAGKYKMVVSYRGDVYPCSYFLTSAYHCGNLLEECAEDIWKKGAGFKPFREMFLKDRLPARCRTCLKKERCFGGCRAFTKDYAEGNFSGDRDIRCGLVNAYVDSERE